MWEYVWFNRGFSFNVWYENRDPAFWHFPRHPTISKSCTISSQRPKFANLATAGTKGLRVFWPSLFKAKTQEFYEKKIRILWFASLRTRNKRWTVFESENWYRGIRGFRDCVPVPCRPLIIYVFSSLFREKIVKKALTLTVSSSETATILVIAIILINCSFSLFKITRETLIMPL